MINVFACSFYLNISVEKDDCKSYVARKRPILPLYYGSTNREHANAHGSGRITAMQEDMAKAPGLTTKFVKLEKNVEARASQITAMHKHFYEQSFIVDVDMSTINLRLLQEDIEVQLNEAAEIDDAV